MSQTKLLGLLKDTGVKLKASGKNVESWGLRMRTFYNAARLQNAFKIEDPDNEADEADPIDALVQTADLKKIANLNKVDIKKLMDDVYIEDEEKQEVATAFAATAMTIPLPLDHFIRDAHDSPAVLWAKIHTEFSPDDGRTIIELHSALNSISLIDHAGDLAKFISEITRISNKLKTQGETISERRLIACLMDGLQPVRDYRQIKFQLSSQKPTVFADACKELIRLSKINKNDLAAMAHDEAEKEAEMALFHRTKRKIWIKKKEKTQDRNNDRSVDNENDDHEGSRDASYASYLKWKRSRGRGNPRGNQSRGGRRGSRGRRGRRGGRRGGRGRGNRKRERNLEESQMQRRLKRNVECYVCGVKGHYARECWFKDDQTDHFMQEVERKKRASREKKNNQNYDDHAHQEARRSFEDSEDSYMMENVNAKDGRCILDCGATRHIWNQRKDFFKLQRLKTPIKMNVGKQGMHYLCTHKGELRLTFNLPNRKTHVSMLRGVLFSKHAAVCCISQSKLDQAGCKFVTQNGTTTIHNPKGEIFAQAHLRKGLYEVDCIATRDEPPQSSFQQSHDALSGGDQNKSLETSGDAELMEFETAMQKQVNLHRKFVHMSHRKIGKAIDATLGIRKPKRWRACTCTACDLTQTKRPKHTKKRAPDDQLENRIHSDVKTLPRSIRGYKGFVVFVHETTGNLEVRKIKKKSDVEQLTKQVILTHERISGARIVEFRSDGGGEFITHKLTDWLRAHGIKHTPCPPHTPQLNAVAERAIQTIVNKTKAILRQSGLSKAFWCYAVDTVVHTLNRIPTWRDPQRTPHELLTGKKPNVGNLTVFGCIGVASVHKNEEKRRRGRGLGDTGELVRMMGYDEGDRFKTYIVMTKSGRILRRQVNKWHENVFRFKDLEKQLPSKEGATDAALDPCTSEEEREEEEKEKTPPTLRRSGRSNRGVPGLRMNLDSKANETYCLHHFENNAEDEVKVERFYSSVGAEDAKHITKDADVTVAEIENVPRTFHQAVTGPEKAFWIPSIKSELRSLRRNHTWDIIRKEKGMKPITTKWVFKKKIKANGLIRFKSRLVARGFSQEKGVNFFKTYAPTLSLPSLRIFLAVASRHKLAVRNLDIRTAYLYGQVDADIHLEIPEGFEPETEQEEAIMKDEAVCRLNKGLYGLKQSALLWNRTLVKALLKMGFRQMQSDPCIFTMHRKGRMLILAVYVDDMLVAREDDDDLNHVLEQLKKDFTIEDIGEVKQCLGIEVEKDAVGNFCICQTGYIERMMEKFKLHASKSARTPLQKQLKTDGSPPVDPSSYRSMIGAILYVAVATRPDVSFATSMLSEASMEPTEAHFAACQRLIKFLFNTRHYKISFHQHQRGIEGFADASHENRKDGKSTSGYFVSIAGGPVIWGSHKQKVVASSTALAETIALSQLGHDIVFVKQLVGEMGFTLGRKQPQQNPTMDFVHMTPIAKVFEDCNPAIRMNENAGLTKASKTVRLAFHNVRELIRDKVITLVKVDSEKQPADILTKALSKKATLAHSQRIFKTSQL